MTLIFNGTDNSVSNPAIQGGTGGTTTGVYYPSANAIAISTGGVNALTISNTQAATFTSNVSFSSQLSVPAAGIKFSDNTTITSNANPNVTVYTSGSGTYTTPTGAKYLQVFMVGGGGGGYGGSVTGAAGAVGGTGGNTTFGTSLLTCNGSAGSIGGAATIGSGPSGMAFSGGRGFSYTFNSSTVTNYLPGGNGASTPFSSGGAGGAPVGPGLTPTANSGAGGGGGSSGNNNDISGAAGGGAGGYINAIISNPSATYSYAIGAGGTGGAAGSVSAAAGGAGAAGVIYVYAYF
jgi:hypothetical protein